MNAVARTVQWIIRGGATALLALVVTTVTSCAGDVDARQLAEEYFNLGNAYFRLGDYQSSFDYYSRALALSDHVPAAGYNLARLHEQRGDYDEALKVLDGLLAEDPENGLYRETRAFVLFRSGRFAPARSAYADLILDYPARVRIRYNLGLLELDNDRPDNAYQALSGGLEYASGDEEYTWVAAEAAHLSGREQEAQELLERFRALNEEDPDDLARLATRQAEWGFTLAAIELFESIPETVEDDPELLFAHASVYLRGTEEFDRGVRLLVQAVEAGFDVEDDAYRRLLEDLREDEQAIIVDRVAETLEDQPDVDADDEEDDAGDSDDS